ncbi:MAG: hypothetical protein FWD27_03110 [Coriobacteriia bacterium]|nr:hypothetical protein [Coriobacteriia bacterium]
MKSIIKRSMALVLAAIMAVATLGVAPMMAFGDEPEEVIILAEPICKIADTGYGTLEEALKAAINGDVVTLLTNHELSGRVVIPAGLEVSFDLNGYTLTILAEGPYPPYDPNSPPPTGGGEYMRAPLILLEGSTLTVAGGTLNAKHDMKGYSRGIEVMNEATLKLGTNGIVNGEGGTGISVEEGARATVTSVTGIGWYHPDFPALSSANAEPPLVPAPPIPALPIPGVGAIAWPGGELTVTGNIYSDGVGISWPRSDWFEFPTGGKITVNGSIVAPQFIRGNNPPSDEYIYLTADDHEEASTKDGYLEYTDGYSFVWVLAPAEDPKDDETGKETEAESGTTATGADGNSSSAIPATGDAGFLVLAALLALAALGTASITLARRRISSLQ